MSNWDGVAKYLEILRTTPRYVMGFKDADIAEWLQFFAEFSVLATPITLDVERSPGLEDAAGHYGRDLLVNGAVQLPYNACLFEGRFFDGAITDTNDQFLLLAAQMDTTHYDDDWAIALVALFRRPPRRVFSLWHFGYYGQHYKRHWKPDEIDGKCIVAEDDDSIHDQQLQTLLYLIVGLLNLKNAEHSVREISARALEKRQRRGGNPEPARYVTIRLNRPVGSSDGSGTHASPRPHWRRGHVRRLQSGRLTTVSPTMVGGAAPVPRLVRFTRDEK